MKLRFRIGLLLLLLAVCDVASAQQKQDTIRLNYQELLLLNDTIYYGNIDSVVILNGTTDYQILKNSFVLAKDKKKLPEEIDTTGVAQNKLKKFVLEQIYDTKEKIPKGFNPSDDYFKNFEGKIIKQIIYSQVAVLDGNVFDTTNVATGFGRFLNKTHAPTKTKVLKDNTRFKTNQALNSRVFSDNERILRNLPYVEEAKIYVVPIVTNSDSVNVLVVSKDKYPIGVGMDVNDYNYFEVEPYSRNFLGLGHRIGANIIYKGDADQKIGYGLSYLADNILGTFTNGELAYLNSHSTENFYTRFEKPFVSTDTRFGGEIEFEWLSTNRIITHYLPDSLLEEEDHYTVQSIDMWMGHSIFISKELTKPFINLAARYYSDVYSERPEIDSETNFFYHDKHTYLGAFSYQQIAFLETSKLLGFGSVEYVPKGFNLGLTLGWQKTSYVNRPYAGFHVNYSAPLKKAGMLSVLANVGGYRRNSKIEDAVAGTNLSYISPLISVSNFELRNIFSFSFNTNINPLYLNKITFDSGLQDLDEVEQYGNSTILVKYQPIFYTPYEWLGFNLSLNPYIHLGWIGESKIFDSQKYFHSVLGLGASIKNESLIFPAMHLYAGYHPNYASGISKFTFEIVFKDYKILNFFADLKPKTAHPEDFYW